MITMLNKILFFLLNHSTKMDFICEYLIKRQDISFPTILIDSKSYEDQVSNLKKGRTRIYYYVHYKVYGYKNKINPHPLFDTQYYTETYPDVCRSGMNPLLHFYEIGSKLFYNPHPLFDTKYYIETYRDVSSSDMNPLLHFIEVGAKLLYNPHPAFISEFYKSRYLNDNSEAIPIVHFITMGWKLGYNPNELFDVNFYLENNQDVALYAANPFIHYMMYGYKEQRDPASDFRYPYFKHFFSTPLKENGNPIIWYYSLEVKPELPKTFRYKNQNTLMHDLVIRASDIEPKIAYDYLYKDNVDRYPLRKSKISEIFEKEVSTLSTKPDYILLLPWLSKGGADWTACVHINYLLSLNYNVLVITTDSEDLTSHYWLTQKPVIFSLSKYKNDIDSNDYLQLILSFCVHLKPKVIHNNNSRLGWDLYKMYGKQLSSASKIYASIFCHDYDKNNIKMGYITTYLNDTIKYIDYIFTDNIQIIQDMKAEFGFTQKTMGKFKNIYYLPQKMNGKEGVFLNRNLNQIISESERPKVLWASRISNQKRVDILLKIVQQNPHIDFYIFGYADPLNEYYASLSTLPNAKLKGKYSTFSEILDINYIALLYTSSWDGLPNVLIEASLAGLPIISSNVGGIKELINQQSGYLIEDPECIEAYSKALSDIIQHPDKASSLAKNAYSIIMERHTVSNMESVFSECGYLI